eukprot:5854856-Prymnesium_polylepis.1
MPSRARWRYPAPRRINRAIKQSSNQAIKHSRNHTITQSRNEAIGQSGNRAIRRSREAALGGDAQLRVESRRLDVGALLRLRRGGDQANGAIKHSANRSINQSMLARFSACGGGHNQPTNQTQLLEHPIKHSGRKREGETTGWGLSDNQRPTNQAIRGAVPHLAAAVLRGREGLTHRDGLGAVDLPSDNQAIKRSRNQAIKRSSDQAIETASARCTSEMRARKSSRRV